MDTSKEYIEMCEKAEEIQKYFKATDEFDKVIPSFVYDGYIDRISNLVYAPIRLRKDLNSTSEVIVLSIEHERDEGRMFSELEHPKVAETCIWLPRQDQLQGMVQCSSFYSHVTNAKFQQFIMQEQSMVKFLYENREVSYEQLWLAYVMFEKFGKVWTGEEWVKNDICIYSKSDSCKYQQDEPKALLPSLEGWVKVEKCEHYHKGCNGTFLSGGNCAADCHGTGQICSPLQFEDVDWNEVLDTLITLRVRGGFDDNSIGARWIDDALTTKSGEVIRREEK